MKSWQAWVGPSSPGLLCAPGPGPVPSLDGQNVVFGTVLEGFGTVSMIAQQPTFKPSQRIQAFNQLATLIGARTAQQLTWQVEMMEQSVTECVDMLHAPV